MCLGNMKKTIFFLTIGLCGCISNAFAQDMSNATMRRDGSTLSTDTQCAILVSVPANNAAEYNLKVSYLDSRMRIFNKAYAGYTAASIVKGKYKVSLDFNQNCNEVLTEFVGQDLFPESR